MYLTKKRMDYRGLEPYRPIPFYFLNTTDPEYYSEDAVFSAMEKMKDLGFGGIVLFNKPPTGFDSEQYLSDYWFEVTGKFILAAKKMDLQLWINDGFNFPPGDAAGRIEAADPTLKQLRLMPNQEGHLNIQEVPWGFPAFEEKASSDLFIKFVYEEYYKRFADFFGKGITGFFSDADNRRFNAHVSKDCPERYYPWSRDFATVFKKRYGYPIESHLKELFTDPTSEVQKDYWELCGILYQNWFARNHAWCKAHNVLYTFHTSDTGPFAYEKCRRSSAFTEGDPLSLLSYSDCPGTDHEIMVLDGGTHYDSRYYTPKATLGGAPEYIEHPKLNDTSLDIRAKYAGSAAMLNHRQRVLCEMFAATNWSASLNDLRRIAAWQIMQGVNFIVPHAVHHRFLGEVKFFAPPEFSHSTLRHGMRQFNDMLARWCQAASAGDYCADFAVINPTRQVWKGKDPTPFFQFCDRLNRRADGYVIVPETYCGEIPNVIDPLKRIPELPSAQITFTGGELAYMRRKLQGEEYLLAANIWNPESVSGILTFGGHDFEVELEPGEIAIFGGPFESFRKPKKNRIRHTFADEYDVRWHEPNIIPFDHELCFAAPLGMKLSLLLPAGYSGWCRLNGRLLQVGDEVKIYDDRYRRVFFDAEGKNTIELERTVAFSTPALLQGDFDVELKTTGDYAKIVYRQYVMDMYEPEIADFTLQPRRNKISLSRGWEKQGQLFYSGEALIHLGQVEIEPWDCLELPGFREIAELLIDGRVSDRKGLSPYRFELPEGRHDLSLRLWNRMANRLERYALSAGVTKPPVILSCFLPN